MIQRLSLIVSVYNEEAVLDQFYAAARPVLESLPCDYELLFVNDGSKDGSAGILERFALQNPKVKVVSFARNYGHESAMIAGIDYSTGDGLICMDADLQHPVECIPEIVQKFNEGYEVITMIRTANRRVPLWKKISSGLFYKVLNSLSDVKFDDNASDFFCMTRQPANILKKYFRESKRFLRAFVQNIGFKKTSIEYEAHDRAAGVSKYNFKRLVKFSISALISFSDVPLRIATWCGAVAAFFSLLVIVYTVVSYFVTGTPDGYATTIVVICGLFMVVFFLLGIIGEYLATILAEVRRRPIYLVRDVLNMEGKYPDGIDPEDKV